MYELKKRVVKPRWGTLYTLSALLVGLVGLVEIAIPAGTARQVLEVVATLAGFAAMAIWVRLNRVALDMAGAGQGSPSWMPPSTVPRDVSGTRAPHSEVLGVPHAGGRCGCSVKRQRGRCRMSDVIYVGLALVFLGLSWAFVKLCERV